MPRPGEEALTEENKQIMRENVEKFIDSEYTAFNERKTQATYTGRRFDLNTTRERVDYISGILGNLDTTEKLHITEEEIKLLQRSDNSLCIIENHKEFPLATTAALLAERIGETFAPEEARPNLEAVREKGLRLSYRDNPFGDKASYDDFKKYGGVSRHKVMPAFDALRLEKKSGGYLAAVPCGQKGMLELRPSMPEKVTLKGKQVELRRTYNYVIKAIFSSFFDENDNIKKNAGEIGDRLDEIFRGFIPIKKMVGDKSVKIDYDDEKARTIMMELLLPELKKILRRKYFGQGLSARTLEKRTDTEANKIIDNWIGIQKDIKVAMQGDSEIELGTDLKEISEAVHGDHGKWEEKAKKAGASEEEIEEIRNERQRQLAETIEKLKGIRDFDPEGKETPIQGTCTSNANFIQAAKLNFSGKLELKYVYKYKEEYVMKYPQKVLEFMLKDFCGFTGQASISDLMINGLFEVQERMRGYLDKLKEGKKLTDKELKDYASFAMQFSGFEFHVGGKVLTQTDGNGDQIGYTTEAFARAPWEVFSVPYTLDGYVGEYKGATREDRDGDAKSMPEMDEAEMQRRHIDPVAAINSCRFINEGMVQYYKADTIFPDTKIKRLITRIR